MHWARKAKITREIRSYACSIGKSGNWQGLWTGEGPYVVTLIWEVTDKRRRDVGASGPTLKAWIDGMVDAELFTRDSHDVVAEERLRIEIGTKKGVRIEIGTL
jgi:hypothetical protein